MPFPADNAFEIPDDPLEFTNDDFEETITDFLLATKKMLGGRAPTVLTIASGGIIPTQGVHLVDTEGAASTDDLTQISPVNFENGALLLLLPASASRVVVAKNTTNGYGSINLVNAQNYQMNALGKGVLLRKDGAQWKEVTVRASEVLQEGRGRAVFQSSGTFTVPASVTKIFVTQVGGGGGGGGGQGLNNLNPNTAPGADGSVGGATSFGTSNTGGGAAGRGGQSTRGGGAFGTNSMAGEYGIVGGRGGSPILSVLGHGQGGRGGNGAGNISDTNPGGGGSSGGMGAILYQVEMSVSPSAEIPVVIGTGGAGGAGGIGVDGTGTNGQAGANGLVIVEW